jgi:hypothetical protein
MPYPTELETERLLLRPIRGDDHVGQRRAERRVDRDGAIADGGVSV